MRNAMYKLYVVVNIVASTRGCIEPMTDITVVNTSLWVERIAIFTHSSTNSEQPKMKQN